MDKEFQKKHRHSNEEVYANLVHIMEETIDIADSLNKKDAKNELLSEQLHKQMFELSKVIRKLKSLNEIV